MMKIKYTLLMVLLFPLVLKSQERKQIFYPDFVEAYYDKNTDVPLVIYDRINGQALDTVKPLDSEKCWYKLTLSDSEKGWFRIENLMQAPCPEEHEAYLKYKGKWIHSPHFKIDIPIYIEGIKPIKLYAKPSRKAEVVFQATDFTESTLIQTHKVWAKVIFVKEGKTIEAWLDREDQCAYPWAACP